MSKYYLGIDIGGTDIKLGVVDKDYKIVSKHSIPTVTGRPVEEMIAEIAAAGKETVKMAGLSDDDIIHIG